MSLLDKASPKKKPGFSIKPLLLPAYIVLSALFIIWVAYSYFNNAVYTTGAQVGYQQALVEIASQSLTEQGCQGGVPINLGNGQSVVLLNAQCLQQPAPTTAPEGGEEAGQ